MNSGNGKRLGINGLGRIGKLSLWHHLGRKYFEEIVVNIGRGAGKSMEDVAHYIERDSTYGLLSSFLYGQQAGQLISDLDEQAGTGSHRLDETIVIFGQDSRGTG